MVKALFSEKHFSILLAGNLLSRCGDGINEFIFILTVLKLSHKNIFMAGIVYFFHFIPYLFLGPFGGAVADHISRKKLMIFADITRMAITTLFCFLLIYNTLTIISLVLIGLFMTALRTVFQPAFQATIPSLLSDPKNLPHANGATQVVGEMGGVIGPALGGAALAAGFTAGETLVIDAVTYFVSAFCIACIPILMPAKKCDIKLNMFSLRFFWDDFRNNITTLFQEKNALLITILYSSACILFAGAALRILIPAMLKNAGYADSLVGYAMSAISFGTIIGAVLCAQSIKNFSTPRLMFYWIFYGITMALLPLCLENLHLLFIGCLMLGVSGAFVDVVLPTNIQSLSNNENLGKNFSLFSTLANTGEALSGTVAGVIILTSSLAASVTIIGLLVALLAYIGKKHDSPRDMKIL